MAKQQAAKQADSVNSITGILTVRLDRARLEAAAKALGVTFPDGATDEKAAVNLYSRYLKAVGGDSAKLVECEVCRGRSPSELDGCPYCNETEPAKPAPQEANMEAKKDGKKQTSLALVEGGKGKAAAALAVVTPASLVGKTDKDLDKVVQEVFALKTKSAMGMWELGCKIREIYDGQLWKLRSEGGKPRYKTAESFCTAELNMSVTHAWALMDVSRNYTSKDVEKFGTTKLGLLLQAPEAARPAIREQIEKGASKKAVAEEVRKANKGKKTTTRRDTGKEVKKSAGRPAKKLITVANIVGSQTIKMYAKASVTKDSDKKDWKPAKRLVDVPTCTMELENDVEMTLTLLDAGDGSIKVKVDIHRTEG